MHDGRFPPHDRRGGPVAALALLLVSAACSGSTPRPAPVEPAPTPPGQPAPTLAPAVATSMLAATGPSTTVFVSAGLAFDEFVDNSYAAWLDHHPELVTSLGIAADLGMTNDRLDDLSPEGIAAAQQLEVAILAALHAYDRESLDPEQQLTFDVYEWWLQHLVDGHRWAYHDYPVHHFVNSYNDQLLRGLTEEHPLATEQDAADYLAKVAQIAPQVGHLIEGLETRRDLGVLPPDFILEMTIGRLKGDLGSSSPSADTVDVERLALVARLDAALAEIPGLTEARHRELAAEVRTEAAASFVPAWIALIEHLESLRSLVTADAGLWRLPDGDAYYAYVLRDQTSTSLTAAEIHELGLAEVERVTSEMRAVFDRLGYPSGAGMGELRAMAARDGGFLSGVGADGTSAVVAAYAQLIVEAEVVSAAVFNTVPQAKVEVVPEQVGRGGFYVPGSADGSRPGAFHAGAAGSSIPRYIMPTIAYHEAVPGHHFQIALAQELDLPLVRRFTHYNAFVEGWALYAERLAYELGLYDDDPFGDIGRLELELLRAIRLVADTGIQAMGWSRSEARSYIESALGDSSWSHEVDRYVVLPGQATGYMIGLNTILDLRDQYEPAGQRELASFHDLVIGGGSLPLEILERIVLTDR